MNCSFSALNGAPCPSQGTNLMGSLNCLYGHHGRTSLSGYKKRFWVLNEALNRLEVYKNDQAHVPQYVLNAEDIRNVIYAHDKQNRFYMLILQTRPHHSIRFRMISSEEREKWNAAITKLMDTYSKTNRRVNILQMVERQCYLMSHKLGVRINVEAEQIISNIPDVVFQYVLEAVDAVIANIAVIVRTFGTDMEMPLSYTLSIDVCGWNSNRVSKGPQYDPTKRSMVLNITLYHDTLGHVHFTVTSVEKVLRLLQSNVFRNPLVEGWITIMPGCATVCQAIREILKANKNFGITFKWGLNFQDNANAEAYLKKFVHLVFFEAIYAAAKNALLDIVRILEGAGFATEPELLSDLLSPVSSPLRSRLHQGGMGKGLYVAAKHTRSFKKAMRRGKELGLAKDLSCRDGKLLNWDMSACAARLVSSNITGLAIVLEENVVNECEHPPPVCVEHSLEYGQRLRPAFLLLGKYRAIFSKPSMGLLSGVPLRRQLFEVALHDLLYRKGMALRSKMTQIFDKDVKVIVAWEQLLQTLKRMDIDVTLEDIPLLMDGASKCCLTHISKLAKLLQHASVTISGATNDAGASSMGHQKSSLFDTFCKCVSLIHITFVDFKAHKGQLATPEPAIMHGSLVDTLTCTKANMLPNFLEAARKDQLQGRLQSPSRVTTPDLGFYALPHDVRLCALTENLGAWCEAHFSTREHSAPPVRGRLPLIEDVFENCSDTCVVPDLIPELNYGEKVANERSAEIRLFNMKRVVNSIYDSQGDVIDLKISAKSILQAIHSFSSAFKGVNITKHDLLRVLVVNLHRLRRLYSHSIGGYANSYLNEEKAETLLINFCEYKESEEGILLLLRSNTEQHLGTQSMHLHPGLKSPYGSLAKVPSADRGSQSVHFDASGARFSRYLPLSTQLEREPDTPVGSTISIGRKGSISSGVQHAQNCGDSDAAAGTVQSPAYTKRCYDFTIICHVALNYLLPREAILASKAWRTGFVFGLENVGKSLIINSLHGVVLPTVATIGLSQQVVSFKGWIFSLRELGGRESFREKWLFYCKHMKEVNFLFFVMDCMNSSTFKDAYKYLRSVAKYYSSIPLVVVYNNFRDLPRGLTDAQLNERIKLQRIRAANPRRAIITASCNVTVVHSSFRVIPPPLQIALQELSDVLLARCPEDRRPSIPKSTSDAQASTPNLDSFMNDYSVVLDHAGNVVRVR